MSVKTNLSVFRGNFEKMFGLPDLPTLPTLPASLPALPSGDSFARFLLAVSQAVGAAIPDGEPVKKNPAKAPASTGVPWHPGEKKVRIG